MSTPIVNLWKAALKTFTGQNDVGYKFCQQNFEKLHSLINEIKADDVKLTPEILRFVEFQPAPMCFIHIFENDDISISVFILKNGVTMPIHDHPGMHGLLKVLSGVVNINSYTIQSEIDYLVNLDKKIEATSHAPEIVNKNDPACILTPRNKNLHGISCVEGPAAFLDILSPPYKVDIYGDGERPCTYFKIISSNETSSSKNDEISDKVQLIVTDSPPDFFSKTLKYSGPVLS
ncbi:2-aminoethanethiol dioxygenase isoform X2 [Leptopilina boulardi]|nr:2-aminoethanethiol dioxygenase isoform X2 [Leptopilina boulardi]